MALSPSANVINKTVNIETLTITKSRTGERTKSWASKATSVKCGIFRPKELVEIYGRLGIHEVLRFVFDTDQSLTTADRIVYNSNNYEIIRINNGGQRGEIWFIDAERKEE